MPGSLFKCLSQQPRGLFFHDNLALKISARSKAPVLMRRPRVTIGTGMKAPTIRIHTPPERQVRAVVPAENVTGGILEHAQPGLWRRLEKLPMERVEWIRWIG